MYYTCGHSQVFGLLLIIFKSNVSSLSRWKQPRGTWMSLLLCFRAWWWVVVAKQSGKSVEAACVWSVIPPLLPLAKKIWNLAVAIWQPIFSPADVKDAICTGCNFINASSFWSGTVNYIYKHTYITYIFQSEVVVWFPECLSLSSFQSLYLTSLSCYTGEILSEKLRYFCNIVKL